MVNPSAMCERNLQLLREVGQMRSGLSSERMSQCSTFGANASVWGQNPLTFQGIYQLTSLADGNWAECSTELAPIIEFLAQGSIKPEPRWLVPLRQPKMPENEWKPMLRLFHWKMICCYEMRKGRGSCVEPSSLKNFGSMFDAEAIHAQIPSNIEPNYQRTWCNGHKTGHASFLSSYIANLPLVSPMFVLGQVGRPPIGSSHQSSNTVNMSKS